MGAIIVYCIYIYFSSSSFLPWYYLFTYCFCGTHTLSKNSVPVTEKNWFLPAVQPCRRLWLFGFFFRGSVSSGYNWAFATSLLIDLARNISRSRCLNLSDCFCFLFGIWERYKPVALVIKRHPLVLFLCYSSLGFLGNNAITDKRLVIKFIKGNFAIYVNFWKNCYSI